MDLVGIEILIDSYPLPGSYLVFYELHVNRTIAWLSYFFISYFFARGWMKFLRYRNGRSQLFLTGRGGGYFILKIARAMYPTLGAFSAILALHFFIFLLYRPDYYNVGGWRELFLIQLHAVIFFFRLMAIFFCAVTIGSFDVRVGTCFLIIATLALAVYSSLWIYNQYVLRSYYVHMTSESILADPGGYWQPYFRTLIYSGLLIIPPYFASTKFFFYGVQNSGE